MSSLRSVGYDWRGWCEQTEFSGNRGSGWAARADRGVSGALKSKGRANMNENGHFSIFWLKYERFGWVGQGVNKKLLCSLRWWASFRPHPFRAGRGEKTVRTGRIWSVFAHQRLYGTGRNIYEAVVPPGLTAHAFNGTV